jgi:hypothetical protein
MIQYRASQPAKAYRITSTQREPEERRVEFEVEPVEEAAQPVYLKGIALPERLSLEFGSPTGEWRQRVELEPLATLTARLEAVAKGAASLTSTGH